MRSSGYFKTGCWILTIPTIAIFFGICFGAFSSDIGTILGILSALIGVIIIAIIFWLIGTGKAVKEFYVFTRDAIIDIFTIKREVKQKCPSALKAAILEKKEHSVKVGIFDYQDNVTEKVTISGNGIVNDDLYVGQIISL